MNELGKRIVDTITAQGPISIAEFMTLSLHDPQGGAYASRNPIGAGGDYITSPEVSQTFGEMCGLWLTQCWQNQKCPKAPMLVELGPGRGTMIRDALRAIHSASRRFFEGLEVVLVEASPVLEQTQRAALAEFSIPIRWVKSFADVTVERPLFLVANEFFDCLPIHQYVKMEFGWCEKMVGVKDGELILGLKKLPVPADVLPPGFDAAPQNGIYETNPATTAIAADIARAIVAQGGAALFIDYGYDEPNFTETLQAIKRHKHADVLSAPGSCDLSAHVDFPALIKAGADAGAAGFGPIEQGDFLVELGIEVRAQRLVLSNPEKAKIIVDGIKRLIDPEQMGSLFKVAAFVRQGEGTPPGFEVKKK